MSYNRGNPIHQSLEWSYTAWVLVTRPSRPFTFANPLVPGLVKNGPGTSEAKRIASASQFGELCEDSSEHVILHYRGFPIETDWSRGEETVAGHSVAPGGHKKRGCFTCHIGKQNLKRVQSKDSKERKQTGTPWDKKTNLETKRS